MRPVIRGWIAIALSTGCTAATPRTEPPSDTDASDTSTPPTETGNPPGPPAEDARRVLAASAAGDLASLSYLAPWLPMTTALDAPIRQIVCGPVYCYALHEAEERITVVDSRDLTTVDAIVLPSGVRPRDAAIMGGRLYVVHGGPSIVALSLAPPYPAEDLPLPELEDHAGHVASCDATLYVQARRPANPAIVAFEPATGQSQALSTLYPPDLEMVADCDERRLYATTPELLQNGGGEHVVVDLDAWTIGVLPVLQGNGEAGGLALRAPDDGWMVVHTEFGPGPSSHLWRITPSGLQGGYHDTFASTQLDDLLLDEASDQLFFVDGCTTDVYEQCRRGMHIFHGTTGAVVTPGGEPLDVGFSPTIIAGTRAP